MSDTRIIRDVLPERIQLHEPAFYNGLSTYQLYVQETTEEIPLSLTDWLKLVYGVTPEFNKSATHVQWRVEGSETWIDLFPLLDIKGDKGDGTQLQVSATHIQWKNTTDVNWVDLIALSTIKGDSGHTPYVPDGSTTWWINGVDTGEKAVAFDGAPLLYEDLTPEQIAELQAPALTAATEANAAAGRADEAADNANTAAQTAQTALDAAALEIAKISTKADLVNGVVPSSQLPSYVDDVIEVANFAALPLTGESGKIYITQNDNLTYRWSGTGYAEISKSLALGETSGTAYRGDRGKTAYDHSQIVTGNPHGTTASDVGAAPALTADQNYVTGAEKTVIGNTSGTNTGNETQDTIGDLIELTELATVTDTTKIAASDSAFLKWFSGLTIYNYLRDKLLAATNTWALLQTFTSGLKTTKIIPNSDTTGVVIRNAADTADLFKITDELNNSAVIPIKAGQVIASYGFKHTDNAISGLSYEYGEIWFKYRDALVFGIGPNQILGFRRNVNVGNGYKFGIDVAPETPLDVNGTTTLRDWVYLNNGTHTGDAVGDRRCKVVSGILKTEKSTTINATKGSATFVNVSNQLFDNTDAASSNNEGCQRYRKSGNNSYFEVCMQTGAATYEWIAIKQIIW